MQLRGGVQAEQQCHPLLRACCFSWKGLIRELDEGLAGPMRGTLAGLTSPARVRLQGGGLEGGLGKECTWEGKSDALKSATRHLCCLR